MYYETFGQMKKMLGQMDTWLTAANAHLEAKKVDASVLFGARIALDQFPFLRQVQITCDTAKLAASRLTGK